MEIQEGSNGPLFVVRQKRDDENEDGTPLKEQTDSEEEEQKPEGVDGEDEPHESEQQAKKKRTFKRYWEQFCCLSFDCSFPYTWCALGN